MNGSPSSTDGSPDGEPPARPRHRIARLLGGSVGLLVLLGVTLIVLFVAVFPTSEFIAQRSELASSRAKLETAHSQVAALEEGLDDFNDRVSVGRIARERFSLVNEGEQLYRLSTRAGDSANLPEAWLWPGYARLVQGD